MAWLKIDDGFIENDKIAPLRDRTFRVHLAGLCYCARNLTDGHVSTKAAKVLTAILEFPVRRYLPELVDADLWRPDESDDGHWINDYLIYNPDSVTVKRLREERSEAGKAGAKKRWGDSNSDSDGHGKRHRQPLHAPVVVPSRPVRNLKAVTANQEITHEIDKISRLPGHDKDSWDVVASFAVKLDYPTVCRIRQSAQESGKGVKWAVAALRDEVNDRRAA